MIIPQRLFLPLLWMLRLVTVIFRGREDRSKLLLVKRYISQKRNYCKRVFVLNVCSQGHTNDMNHKNQLINTADKPPYPIDEIGRKKGLQDKQHFGVICFWIKTKEVIGFSIHVC